MSISNNPIFQDEAKAREWLEWLLWPDGPVCPHCGMVGAVYTLNGTAHRPGVYKCKGCEKQFTVTVGTLFERSHIPLNKWLLGFHLMTASKKGISAHQLHRMLNLTYKTAWFMAHRIREAMGEPAPPSPLGGENKVVEMDETYVGGKGKNRAFRKPAEKKIAMALVERDGKVRSFHVPAVSAKTIRPIIKAHIDGRTYLMTDENPTYPTLTKDFAGHGTVNHSADEYVRLGGFMHTNTVENYFSVLKRGIVGTYHHVSQRHFGRYLIEFDFRYNERARLGVTDDERMVKSLRGVVGKRLTYRRAGGQPTAAGEADTEA